MTAKMKICFSVIYAAVAEADMLELIIVVGSISAIVAMTLVVAVCVRIWGRPGRELSMVVDSWI